MDNTILSFLTPFQSLSLLNVNKEGLSPTSANSQSLKSLNIVHPAVTSQDVVGDGGIGREGQL